MADQKTVQLILPNGDLTDVLASSAPTMMAAHGWKEATPENLAVAKAVSEQGGLIGGLKAAGEGLARGFSGGTSESLERHLGVNQADIEARAEAHPYVSGITDFIGGAGLIAAGVAAAPLVAPVAAGGIGAAAIGGAAAGAISGAGAVLNAHEVDNVPVTAEMLASTILPSVILGGALNAAGPALMKGVTKAATTASQYLGGLAENSAFKAVGATGKQLGKLEESHMTDQVARELLDGGMLKGSQENVLKAQGAAKAASSQYGAALDSATGTADAKTLAQTFKEIGAPDKLDKFNSGWKKKIFAYGEEFENMAELDSRQLQTVKKSLDTAIQKAKSGGKSIPPGLAAAKRAVTDALESTIDMAPEEWAAVKNKMGVSREVAKLVTQNRDRVLGSQSSSVGNMMGAGAAATGHFGMGAAYALYNQIPKEMVTRVVAQGAHALNQAVDKGAVNTFLNKMFNSTTVKLGAAVNKGLTEKAVRVTASGLSSYSQAAESVADAAANPTAFAARVQDHIGEDITAHSPEVAQQAAMQAHAAVKYLNDNLPKPTYQQGLFDGKYTPPPSVKAAWMNMYNALHNPESVLTNPSKEGLEAVKNVYPSSYDHIIMMMQKQLQGKNLTYQQKLRVSKFLGPEVYSLMSPNFAFQMQQGYAQQQAEGSGDDQKGSARTGRAKVMNLKKAADQEATQLDRFMEK